MRAKGRVFFKDPDEPLNGIYRIVDMEKYKNI